MKLTKRYAFLVIGNVGNFQMAQETALRFLRILRGLLFPHIVPRFPTTSDYSVAYSTTLLLCISPYLVLKGQKSCARHEIREVIMKKLLLAFVFAVVLSCPCLNAQDVKPENETHTAYCELVGTLKLNAKVKVAIDYGQNAR